LFAQRIRQNQPPQGDVISPLIANTDLDAIPAEMGLRVPGTGAPIARRKRPVNLELVIADLNPVLRRLASCFRMANCSTLWRAQMARTRRRLRTKPLALRQRPTRRSRSPRPALL